MSYNAQPFAPRTGAFRLAPVSDSRRLLPTTQRTSWLRYFPLAAIDKKPQGMSLEQAPSPVKRMKARLPAGAWENPARSSVRLRRVKAARRHYAQPRASAAPIRRYRCPGTSGRHSRIPLSDHRLRETRLHLISFLRWTSSISPFWRHPAAWSSRRREHALPHALPRTLLSPRTRQLRRGIWRS